MTTRPVVLFDANCALCCGMTEFILRHESAPFFAFAAIGSQTGRKIASDYGLTPEDLDRSFAVIINGRLFLRSDAGVEILRRLCGPWRLAAAIACIPRVLRDPAYDTLARRRRAWFGGRACFVPPVGQTHRFLDL
jgi:predicted DCC family thiol-disulfide oxidoreductase YuxK